MQLENGRTVKITLVFPYTDKAKKTPHLLSLDVFVTHKRASHNIIAYHLEILS